MYNILDKKLPKSSLCRTAFFEYLFHIIITLHCFFFLTTQYQTKILSVPPEHRFRYGICVAAAAGAAVPAAGKR